MHTPDPNQPIRELIAVRTTLGRLRLGARAVHRATTDQLPLTLSDTAALLGVFEAQLDIAEARLIDAIAALAAVQADLPE
jgi:hypothetical protein